MMHEGEPQVIGDSHVEEVCLPGKGALCCKYLTRGNGGWHCAKNSNFQSFVDNRAATMKAKGDNCTGPNLFIPLPTGRTPSQPNPPF